MNQETRIAKQDVTVEIQNVTKTFGKHIAVDDLSLIVPQGSIYGFIGPNGSGKTTTFMAILGQSDRIACIHNPICLGRGANLPGRYPDAG